MFIFSAVLLFFLWGINWLSALLLVIYILTGYHLSRSLQQPTLQFVFLNEKKIEVTGDHILTGEITGSSFYNRWVIFLCLAIDESPFVVDSKQHKKWFIIFSDSISKAEYRLFARLITSERR